MLEERHRAAKDSSAHELGEQQLGAAASAARVSRERRRLEAALRAASQELVRRDAQLARAQERSDTLLQLLLALAEKCGSADLRADIDMLCAAYAGQVADATADARGSAGTLLMQSGASSLRELQRRLQAAAGGARHPGGRELDGDHGSAGVGMFSVPATASTTEQGRPVASKTPSSSPGVGGSGDCGAGAGDVRRFRGGGTPAQASSGPKPVIVQSVAERRAALVRAKTVAASKAVTASAALPGWAQLEKQQGAGSTGGASRAPLRLAGGRQVVAKLAESG